MKKNPFKVLFMGLLGIIVMLISIGILNVVALFVRNQVFQEIVAFFNLNLIFVIFIQVILVIAELFYTFFFPINIIYPVFNAVGGALVVIFIRRIFQLIESLSEANLAVLAPLFDIALVVVIIVVLIVGYVKVFTGLIPKKSPKKKSKVEWEDVGDEFKGAAYNLASTVKKKLEPKKKRKKKSKK